MSRRVGDDVLPRNIKFGMGITPFGGMSMAGSPNWFDLLGSVKKKQKKHIKERWVHRQGKDSKKNTREKAEIIQGSPEKKDQMLRRPKAYSLPPSFVQTKHRIPKIKITKASEENLLDLCMDSSDDTDIEDSEDFVYECPGLAARGQDMTVENPLFNEKLFKQRYRTPELPRKFWKDVFTETI